MDIGPVLIEAIQSELERTNLEGASYNWPVGRTAWERLEPSFEASKYSDPSALNIALRECLRSAWSKADKQGKLRLARWIIADWGGIKTNDSKTISEQLSLWTLPRPQTELQSCAACREGCVRAS